MIMLLCDEFCDKDARVSNDGFVKHENMCDNGTV